MPTRNTKGGLEATIQPNGRKKIDLTKGRQRLLKKIAGVRPPRYTQLSLPTSPFLVAS